jgi:microcompartment protein CcmL/EutN
MAQSLELNIKTTSDVPKAMEKAKSATVSFSKQVEDIQKKFSTAFKDIFLGFTAPMVLLQGAIGMISNAIAKAKQDAKDGIDLISKGETVYASSEEQKMAAFFKAKRAREEEMRLVEIGKQEITKAFLESEEGKKFLQEEARNRPAGASRRQMNPNVAIHYESVRKAALDAFLNSEEGKKFKPMLEGDEKKAGNFKGPEGFSNVVGVGSNPVMTAMSLQLEEAQKHTALLQNLVDRNPFGGADFTKAKPATQAPF